MEPTFGMGFLLIMAGAAIGFISGLLGIGGGLLLVPVQYSLLSMTGLDQTVAIRVAFGTSLAVILPTAISGTYGHHCRECVVWRAVLPMGITGVIGAFLGGSFASNAPGPILSFIFGMVIMFGAWRMITSASIPTDWQPDERVLLYAVAGLPVGFLSGLLGIGGGILMVPVFILFMRFSVHQAIGTSTALIVIYSVGGICAYVINGLSVSGLPPYSLGYIDLFMLGALVITSVPMAQLGVRAAYRTPVGRLKTIFGIFLLFIGLKMVGVFQWAGIPFLS